MSILSALKTQNNSIDDLASLPQPMIMQMAQKGQIRQDLVMPILARKAEMVDAAARSKAMQQQGVPPTTVLEQILQKNAVAENPAPRDMGVAQLPVRPDMYDERRMAGGGIVAFAGGGEAEDEDTYTQEELDDMEMDAEMESMLSKGAKGATGYGISASKPASVIGITAEEKQPTGLKSLVEGVKQVESGGRRYDKEGKLLTSSKGAEGEMQVMPATSRDPGFGVKAARDNSPEEKARVGRDYLGALVNHYGDQRLAVIAYNWGPGNTDRWLKQGGDPKKLPEETKQYLAKLSKITELAEGGEVKHYAAGDYVGFGEEVPYDPNEPSIFSRFGEMIGSPLERIKNQTYGKGFVTNAAVAKATPKPVKKDEAGLQEIVERAMMEDNVGKGKAETEKPTVTAKEKDAFEKYLDRIEARRQELVAGKTDDRNMALLAAGLGMLGGTSPYAMANIGQGAMKGVEQYGAAQKARTAEQLALDKAELGGLRYKEYAEMKRNAQDVAQANALRDDMAQYEKMITAQIMGKYKNSPLLMTEKGQSQVQNEINSALQGSKVYQDLRKRAYPNIDFGAPSVASGVAGTYTPGKGLSLNR